MNKYGSSFLSCISSNPKSKHFGSYCKYQLLKYKPWKHSQEDAWDNLGECDETFTGAWQCFLNTSYAHSHVPEWHNKLHSVIEHRESDSNISQMEIERSDSKRKEWMILSDLRQQFSDQISIDPTIPQYDWQSDREKYSIQQIEEMPTWIKLQKEQNPDHGLVVRHNINLESLNAMQRKAYDLVKSHYEDNTEDKEPLLLMILGVAGTGKSYLIHAIKKLLLECCAVCAPTGKASFNIRGVTLHSLLRLPVGQRRLGDLAGESLSQLQANLEMIQYIIIDEYSMLGQTSFGWVDKRCRQATGCKDRILSGKSLILIGDICQLPPVGERVLYHGYPRNDTSQQGYILYHLFNKVIWLTSNERVTGCTENQHLFRELLMRIREGNTTKDDWKTLLTRQPSAIDNLQDFKNATRLFYTKKDVANYNNNKLNELGNPVAQINARHPSAVAKKATCDDMSALV